MALSSRGGPGSYRIESATAAPGAIGVVGIRGDIDAILRALGVGPVQIGAARLRDIEGVDELLVARWAPDAAHLFPHAGPAVTRALAARLEALGVRHESPDDRGLWPEAADEIEARMLATLAAAPSPLAVSLLLEQPERWRAWLAAPESARPGPAEILRHSRSLHRLLSPPLVAAIGASNIGKSSLLNALARREAVVVADEPGTTRDYVGAAIDLGGLVVNWIDCPGARHGAAPTERLAQERAKAAVAGAALVVSCADATQDWLPDPPGLDVLRVATRADLGVRPGAEGTVSVATGAGLEILAVIVLERLLPAESLGFPGPWVFGAGLPIAAGFA